MIDLKSKPMKQHITPRQLKELRPAQLKKLKLWWESHCQIGDIFTSASKGYPADRIFAWDGRKPFDSAAPLLSVGQMIEILDYRLTDINSSCSGWTVLIFLNPKCDEWGFVKDELIDALWEATKLALVEVNE